jgi:hypothetical protein
VRTTTIAEKVENRKGGEKSKPLVDIAKCAAPQPLAEEPFGAVVSLPELESPGDDPGDEDDGVLDAQPLLLQLDPRRVRVRPRDGIGDVLRERRRHRVVEEEQQPPYGAHAPHQPAAAVDARPFGPGPPRRLLRRRRLFAPLVSAPVLVVVGPAVIRESRRSVPLRLLPPPQERHGGGRVGGEYEGYLLGLTCIAGPRLRRPEGNGRKIILGEAS